jgi:hypothetical protein
MYTYNHHRPHMALGGFTPKQRLVMAATLLLNPIKNGGITKGASVMKLSKDFKHAFVVQKSDIERLWKVLQDKRLTVTASIICADNTERDFDNCEELVGYENAKRAAITSLKISGKSSPSGETQAGISFNKEWPSVPISIQLSGEEGVVLPMEKKITDIVDGMRPWYSPVTEVGLFRATWVSCRLFLLMMVATALIMSIKKAAGIPDLGLENILKVILVMWFIGLVGLICLSRIFPVETFAIGQGLRRHERRMGLINALISLWK